MSAGKPDWQKLYEIGKLPKEARGNVPMLAQLDAAEKEIAKIKVAVCDDCREKLFPQVELKIADVVITKTMKCEECEYVAEGKYTKNSLRLHMRSHGKI